MTDLCPKYGALRPRPKGGAWAPAPQPPPHVKGARAVHAVDDIPDQPHSAVASTASLGDGKPSSQRAQPARETVHRTQDLRRRNSGVGACKALVLMHVTVCIEV